MLQSLLGPTCSRKKRNAAGMIFFIFRITSANGSSLHAERTCVQNMFVPPFNRLDSTYSRHMLRRTSSLSLSVWFCWPCLLPKWKKDKLWTGSQCKGNGNVVFNNGGKPSALDSAKSKVEPLFYIFFQWFDVIFQSYHVVVCGGLHQLVCPLEPTLQGWNQRAMK